MAKTPAEALSLAGRVAIVTGAGGGLGHAICDSLAAAGATVIAAGRTKASLDDTVALVSGHGGNIAARVCDISNPDEVAALMQSVAEEFGRIDILVNNAAIYPRRAWTEITADEWDEVMATNLKGYFLCAQNAFPHMKARGAGRIINVASITFFGGWPMLLDYVTSKGGIVGFHAGACPRDRTGWRVQSTRSHRAPFDRRGKKITPTRMPITRWCSTARAS